MGIRANARRRRRAIGFLPIQMHKSSYQKMRDFRLKYLAKREQEALRILDFGCQDVNGSYRPLFQVPQWTYVGVDMVPGRGVDIVLKEVYFWDEIPSNSFDVVISGQAFEHAEYFWLSICEVRRVLKPGGLCCIIAPSTGPEHRYPVDCYRFYPDGMTAMAKFAGLIPKEAVTEWEPRDYPDGSGLLWKDSLLVAKKPPHESYRRRVKHRLLRLALRWLADYPVQGPVPPPRGERVSRPVT